MNGITFIAEFDTQYFRTELDQITSEPQKKVVDDVEDFEIDAKIVECIFFTEA